VPPPDLRQRIDRMFARDTAAAAAFVLVLWATIAFVFVQIGAGANGAIPSVLFVAGGLVVLFNTASIAAMIRHHRSEKHRIYSIDIQHFDAAKAGHPLDE
jgi:hypothetical protein